MTELQSIEQLLVEVGPIFDEIEQILQVSEDTWLVIFDEETAIEVELDTVGQKLSFSMLLGPAQPEQQLEMYTTMLSYSLLKRDTGGFHFGLDGEDGNAHLMLDVCHLDMTATELAGILSTILETGETWREALLGQALPDDTDEEESENVPGGVQV